MRTEQWLFYENFSVFGQIKNLQMGLFHRRHFGQIQGNLAGINFRNWIACEFKAHYPYKNVDMNLKSKLPTDSTFE